MGNRLYVWKGGEETDKYDAIIDCPHYVLEKEIRDVNNWNSKPFGET